MSAPGVRATDVAAACGITYRQMDYWVRMGWLNADTVSRLGGHGDPRIFSEREARVARVMGVLVRSGLKPNAAAAAARRARFPTTTDYEEGTFLTDAGGLFIRGVL